MAWIAARPVVVHRMSDWLIQVTAVNLIFVHLKNNFRNCETFHITAKRGLPNMVRIERLSSSSNFKRVTISLK